MTTRWVAAATKKKYDVVVNTDIFNFYMFAEEGGFVISAAKTKFMLQKKDCVFATTMKLPCRHVMAFKKSISGPFVTLFSAMNPSMSIFCPRFLTLRMCRWYDQSRLSTQRMADVAKAFVAKVYKRERTIATGSLSQHEKYHRT
ncbi:hypothetical protein PHPALM_13917 [Phytophthora palmivora]|uniref:Uncharacterized protein n=1 Tax=Phytophthora palmivora TaxID=4796 RepID=A0A2P4XWC7_9STRA|nr:hypothetical protein PHPALM_13917 [Phytophthora palmivora]